MQAIGTKVRAKLIEEIEKDHWIVSFNGQLIQVKNTTTLAFEEGMILNLEVMREEPIELKVLASGPLRRNNFNIRI